MIFGDTNWTLTPNESSNANQIFFTQIGNEYFTVLTNETILKKKGSLNGSWTNASDTYQKQANTNMPIKYNCLESFNVFLDNQNYDMIIGADLFGNMFFCSKNDWGNKNPYIAKNNIPFFSFAGIDEILYCLGQDGQLYSIRSNEIVRPTDSSNIPTGFSPVKESDQMNFINNYDTSIKYPRPVINNNEPAPPPEAMEVGNFNSVELNNRIEAAGTNILIGVKDGRLFVRFNPIEQWIPVPNLPQGFTINTINQLENGDLCAVMNNGRAYTKKSVVLGSWQEMANNGDIVNTYRFVTQFGKNYYTVTNQGNPLKYKKYLENTWLNEESAFINKYKNTPGAGQVNVTLNFNSLVQAHNPGTGALGIIATDVSGNQFYRRSFIDYGTERAAWFWTPATTLAIKSLADCFGAWIGNGSNGQLYACYGTTSEMKWTQLNTTKQTVDYICTYKPTKYVENVEENIKGPRLPPGPYLNIFTKGCIGAGDPYCSGNDLKYKCYDYSQDRNYLPKGWDRDWRTLPNACSIAETNKNYALKAAANGALVETGLQASDWTKPTSGTYLEKRVQCKVNCNDKGDLTGTCFDFKTGVFNNTSLKDACFIKGGKTLKDKYEKNAAALRTDRPVYVDPRGNLTYYDPNEIR